MMNWRRVTVMIHELQHHRHQQLHHHHHHMLQPMFTCSSIYSVKL